MPLLVDEESPSEETLEILREVYFALSYRTGHIPSADEKYIVLLGHEEKYSVSMDFKRHNGIGMSVDGEITIYGFDIVEVCERSFIGIGKTIKKKGGN